MITLENALNNAKDFIAKMKGLDLKLQGTPLIDLLDFYIIRKEETPSHFSLFVNFQSNVFSANRSSFRVDVNKETGVVEDIEKISEE
ncbi:MAG: hypothetical protein ACTSRI_12120 [Promethearchaeota archaeon]